MVSWFAIKLQFWGVGGFGYGCFGLDFAYAVCFGLVFLLGVEGF
jgi:hypothetical protein